MVAALEAQSFLKNMCEAFGSYWFILRSNHAQVQRTSASDAGIHDLGYVHIEQSLAPQNGSLLYCESLRRPLPLVPCHLPQGFAPPSPEEKTKPIQSTSRVGLQSLQAFKGPRTRTLTRRPGAQWTKGVCVPCVAT